MIDFDQYFFSFCPQFLSVMVPSGAGYNQAVGVLDTVPRQQEFQVWLGSS